MITKPPSPDGASSPIRRIDWEEYSNLCRMLTEKIQEVHLPEVVVGIAHGGVIVGATVATILGRDFFPIKFSRRVNATVVRKHSKLLVPPTAHLEGKRVLIVDDASRTGETMKAAVKAVGARSPALIVTAVLVQSGEYEPQFVGAFFPGKAVFPWQLEGADDDRGPDLQAGRSRRRRIREDR